MEYIKQLFELSATGIEIIGVLIIVSATIFGTLRFLYHLSRRVIDAYKQFKVHMGKTLILVLEFLVAADIIRTVAVDQTIESVLILGILVFIRTFLSWSLEVEVEGCFPWSKNKDDKTQSEVNGI